MKQFCILITITIFISITFSCNKKCTYSNPEEIVTEYIDYFQSLELKPRDFMVKIRVDSTITGYLAYRISTSAQLLSKDATPNKIDIYNGFKISYFTRNLNNVETQKMKSVLSKKEFYNKNDFLIDSNYPEWVIYRKMDDECFILEKHAHYQKLSDIINN